MGSITCFILPLQYTLQNCGKGTAQGAAGSQSSSNAPAMRLLCISAAMWLPAGQQETKVRAVLAELLGLLFSTLVAGQMHNKCLFPSTVRAARDTRLAGHHT